MGDELTDAERRAVEAIRGYTRTDGALTATTIGEILYGRPHRERGGRKRQCYARPGGRIARRLVRAGYLYETVIRPGDRFEQRAYALTGKGADLG